MTSTSVTTKNVETYVHVIFLFFFLFGFPISLEEANSMLASSKL